MPEINNIIGNYGRYHLWLCFLIFTSKFGVAFHQLAIIFLAPPVSYKCPDNSTCCDVPEFDKTKFSKTIVTEWSLICGRSWLKELTQALFQFGVLCGSLVFGIASDRYGRRPTLIVAVIMEIFLGVMSSFLPDFWSFTIIRMILGSAVGGITVIGFVLMMEYVGSPYRDILSSLFHVPFAIGHILLGFFGYLIRDYTYFQLGISLATALLLVYICLLPESPRWLLAANKTVNAIELLESVAKINKLPTENIRDKIELFQLRHMKGEKRKKASILDIFRSSKLRKNMMVMSYLWFASSYCFYGIAHYISHLTGDVFVNVVASASVCLLACFLGIPLMKLLRRRTLSMISNILCGLSLFVVAFIPEGIGSVILGCISIFFSFMALLVAYLHCSEMFPTVVRNAAMGYSSMMARLGAMISPFVVSLGVYGSWCAPIVFGIFPLIAAFLCLLLPETKNCELLMTIEEGEAINSSSNMYRGQSDITEDVT